jgi:hypothetical protein
MIINHILAWDLKRHGNAVDFAELYTGGVLFRENRLELYNYDKQVEILKKIAAPEPVTDERLYLLPPFFAPLLAPFSLLSFPTAYALQTLLNLGFLVWTLRLLTTQLQLGSLAKWLYLATFGFLPAYYALLQGQTTFLFLLLLSLHVLDLPKARSGLWAGLLVFKPHLAAIPLMLLAWRRLLAGIIYAVVTVTILGLVSVALVGIEGILGWIRLLWMIGGFQEPFWMVNLRSLVYFLFAEWDVPITAAASILLLIPVFFAHRRSESNLEQRALSWAATLIVMLLISPHTFIYELSLLILPGALILSAHRERAINWILGAVVAVDAAPFVAAIPKALWQVKVPLMAIVLLSLFAACVIEFRAVKDLRA